MKKIRRSVSISLSLLLLLSVFALRVAADPNPMEIVDTARNTTLTLQYLYNNEPIEGATFYLYRVGDVTKSGSFRFNAPFAGVYDRNQDQATVALQMLTLARSEESGVEPKRTGVTGDNGQLQFRSEEGDRLSTGIYLVASDPLELANEDTYSSVPFLVSLPTFFGDLPQSTEPQDVWRYDVTVVPKAQFMSKQYVIHYSDNNERIGGATVTHMPYAQADFTEIFKADSGKLLVETELIRYVRGSSGASQYNSYRLTMDPEPEAAGYTFEGWNIDPEADEGYTTMPFYPDIREYTVYAIWRANDPPEESSSTPSDEPDTPSGSSDTPSGSSDTPSGSSDTPSGSSDTPSGSSDTPSGSSNTPSGSSQTPTSSNSPGGSDTQKKDPILPQTGMLWWPVPVLAILGFAVFMAGVFMGRKKKSDKKDARSGLVLLAGIVLVSSAVCLVLYNSWDDMRAGSDVAEECVGVVRFIPDRNGNSDQSGIAPDNSRSVTTDMPVKTYQGADFAAVLEIPSLSLELPVRNVWSYPGLRRSPCRYAGSAYTDDLVICGHNYQSHFGKLKNLTQNDEITVTALNGDVFTYRVREVTELVPNAIEEMKHSDYDLTLFTCTIGGSKRVTVRCELTGFRPQSPNVIFSQYVLF